MSFTISTHVERPDLAERAAELGDEFWPEYNRHGDVVNLHWRRMRVEFPELQFVLHDGDEILAEGHTLAIAWDGTADGLPAGFDGIFERAFAGGANALCAMAAEIRPAHRGKGLAQELLAEMAATARTHGLDSLLAAVRPSWKDRYPVAAIDDYMRWTRDDGLPFDPWLRVHVRAGGELLCAEPRSLRITGTVADWETWTGMPFPVSGDYVFPQGLALLAIDREEDRGLYFEPNVWVRHAVPPFTDA
jgi:GNAT superfamily N-acetyltransferase